MEGGAQTEGLEHQSYYDETKHAGASVLEVIENLETQFKSEQAEEEKHTMVQNSDYNPLASNTAS